MNITHETLVPEFLKLREKRPRMPLDDVRAASEKLRDIANEIIAISGGWNAVEFYTPDADCREREERRFKEAFDRGEIYNPQFTYGYAERTNMDGDRTRLQALSERLRSRLVSSAVLAEKWACCALSEKLYDDLATCDMVDGLAGRGRNGVSGDALTKHALARKYWPLDKDLLRFAERDYAQRTAAKTEQARSGGILTEEQKRYLRERQCTPEHTKAAMERMLHPYGLQRSQNPEGFDVVVTEDVTAVDVRHRSAKGPGIYIPAKVDPSDPIIARDVVSVYGRHEIEAHARQAANGWRLFGFWGGRLTCDDETLYEALAMSQENAWLTQYYGSQEETRPYPYVYPTAIDVAQRGGSFHDVCIDQFHRFWRTEPRNPQGQHIPTRDQVDATLWEEAKYWAYRATYRVMRGHRDTANADSFAMTKDLAYERGLLIQRQLNAHRLRHYNEAGIMTRDGLLMMAEIDLKPEDLPLPDRNVADEELQRLLAEQGN